MTRDEILSIATLCGNDNGSTLKSDLDFLVRFAEMIAAHEREACASLSATIGGIWGQQANGEMIARAIRARGEQ